MQSRPPTAPWRDVPGARVNRSSWRPGLAEAGLVDGLRQTAQGAPSQHLSVRSPLRGWHSHRRKIALLSLPAVSPAPQLTRFAHRRAVRPACGSRSRLRPSPSGLAGTGRRAEGVPWVSSNRWGRLRGRRRCRRGTSRRALPSPRDGCRRPRLLAAQTVIADHVRTAPGSHRAPTPAGRIHRRAPRTGVDPVRAPSEHRLPGKRASEGDHANGWGRSTTSFRRVDTSGRGCWCSRVPHLVGGAVRLEHRQLDADPRRAVAARVPRSRVRDRGAGRIQPPGAAEISSGASPISNSLPCPTTAPASPSLSLRPSG